MIVSHRSCGHFWPLETANIVVLDNMVNER
jgi:hypothetical protein